MRFERPLVAGLAGFVVVGFDCRPELTRLLPCYVLKARRVRSSRSSSLGQRLRAIVVLPGSPGNPPIFRAR